MIRMSLWQLIKIRDVSAHHFALFEPIVQPFAKVLFWLRECEVRNGVHPLVVHFRHRILGGVLDAVNIVSIVDVPTFLIQAIMDVDDPQALDSL